MIAFDDSNDNDRWYLTPEYLEVHYSKD